MVWQRYIDAAIYGKIVGDRFCIYCNMWKTRRWQGVRMP